MKSELKKILDIIDKAIPYHIIFLLKAQNEILISTSAKHDHISESNESVIDCTFRTNWVERAHNNYTLRLNESLDQTFVGFCSQLSGRERAYASYSEFVKTEAEIKELESKIKAIKSQIRKERQFNKKVNLNIVLKGLRKQLELLTI